MSGSTSGEILYVALNIDGKIRKAPFNALKPGFFFCTEPDGAVMQISSIDHGKTAAIHLNPPHAKGAYIPLLELVSGQV